jgi:hypothetical protein
MESRMSTRQSNILVFVSASVITLLSGCSATESSQPPTAKAKGEIITGSNVPRKDPSAIGTKVIDPKDIESARNNPSGVQAPANAK